MSMVKKMGTRVTTGYKKRRTVKTHRHVPITKKIYKACRVLCTNIPAKIALKKNKNNKKVIFIEIFIESIENYISNQNC